MTTRQIVLAARPIGFPKDSDFRMEEVQVPAPGPGQFLVKNLYMSVDPYMRGRMNDTKSYSASFQVNQVMDGGAIGEVVESNNPNFPKGVMVSSMGGWREHFVSDGKMVTPVNPKLAPPSAFLGVLGIPGFTAWYGLKFIGEPKAGETLVVSAAAGATGSLAGQLGKLWGCRVVGTAGSAEKCEYLKRELGFDAVINYKAAGNLDAALREACPKGIDVYFENVGGAMQEAVLRQINADARIVLCGLIDQYNDTSMRPGPNWATLLINRAKVQGFIISFHFDKLTQFFGEVGPLVAAGKVKYQETVVEGLANAPRAFMGLLRGENAGKMVVKL